LTTPKATDRHFNVADADGTGRRAVSYTRSHCSDGFAYSRKRLHAH